MAALVYIVILAMWAAVLLPMWARRRDESRSLRTVDEFRRALTTLSDDPRMASLLPTSAAMHRRRRVYAGLAGLFCLMGMMWSAQIMAFGWLAVPVVLGAAFTFAARKQVREETRRRDAAIRYFRTRARCMAAHPSSAAAVVRPSVVVTRPATAAVRPAVRLDDGLAVTSYEVPEAVAVGQSWEAQPIMLPTYVTAPSATAVRRNIDVASAGVFGRKEMLRQAEDVRRARAEAYQPDFIDEILEQSHQTSSDEVFDQYAPPRRAVNG